MRKYRCKSFDELTNWELYNILKARSEIFMMEQDIHYLDMDDVDYDALHVFSVQDGRVTSYLRMYHLAGDEMTFQIGRVLTRKRGRGEGAGLIAEAEENARKAGAAKLTCDAQVQSRGFYERVGFQVVSSEFIEAGIPHIKMEKAL